MTEIQRRKAKETPTLLPPDVHYHTDMLMSLFIKPNWMIPKHKLTWTPIIDNAAEEQTVLAAYRSTPSRQQNLQTTLDAGPWGEIAREGSQQQQQDLDAGDLLGGGGGYDDDDDDGYGAGFIQVDTQRGYEQPAEAHLIKQAPMAYARVAKRVDVKALKATIWRTIESGTEDHGEARPMEDDDAGDGADKVTNKPFQEMLNEIPQELNDPRELQKVSVPFCFISLLHLANERGLTLHNPDINSLSISVGAERDIQEQQ